LKGLEDFGNTDSAHAEHMGQELMGEQEFIRHSPIMRHQNPSATPLLHRMQAIAGNGLRNLLGERRIVPDQ
jgi:hypothetical protein